VYFKFLGQSLSYLFSKKGNFYGIILFSAQTSLFGESYKVHHFPKDPNAQILSLQNFFLSKP